MRAFDVMEPRARSGDPETSHEAAASVKACAELRRYIVLSLSRHGRSTDEDLAFVIEHWGIKASPSGLRTRRAELVKLGKVVDSGERRTLLSGRLGIVWRLA